MKIRFALLAILIAGIAVVLVRSLPTMDWMGETRHASTSEPAQSTAPFTSPPRDSTLKFEILRERMLSPYRLRPDRRLLLALTQIRRLAGAPDSALTVQFAAGRWTVLCGLEEVGKLSELPDFPEMLDLLTEWARKQAWKEGWA